MISSYDDKEMAIARLGSLYTAKILYDTGFDVSGFIIADDPRDSFVLWQVINILFGNPELDVLHEEEDENYGYYTQEFVIEDKELLALDELLAEKPYRKEILAELESVLANAVEWRGAFGEYREFPVFEEIMLLPDEQCRYWQIYLRYCEYPFEDHIHETLALVEYKKRVRMYLAKYSNTAEGKEVAA